MISISDNDFGMLVETFIRGSFSRNYTEEWLNKKIREWWPNLEDYYKRNIQTAIEVEIELDNPPRYNRHPLQNKEMWVQFLKEFRPGKSPFTVDYRCHKCEQTNVKLWRGVHGCTDADGHELLCAACLAPEEKIDDLGKYNSPGEYSHYTDQINGWLPAVPVDDTYWGYSSVPSQDVEWWQALPTYNK